MVRRRRCAAAFRLAILGLTSHAAIASAADDLKLQKLADGVFVHVGAQAEASAENRGDIANIGFIVGEKCVAVIDTGGTLMVGRALRAAIVRTTPKPICYVINTHVHPDHVFGNAAFERADTQFVGHKHLPAALAARSDSFQKTLSRELGDIADGSRLIAPTTLVESDLDLDLGGRNLSLHAWNTAHTDNDLSVFDSMTGTLWTGDLLFVDRIPVIDGSLLGWLKALAALRAGPPPRHIVPGHGPIDPPWPAALAAEMRYLETVATDVRAALKAGRTLAQTVETVGLSERSHWLLFDDYNRRNATAAYTELEWED